MAPTQGGLNPIHKKKKRRRRLDQIPNLDLPDIPGLPVSIIPLQMHALQQTAQWAHETNNTPLCFDEQVAAIQSTESRSYNNNNKSDNVVSSILNRIEQSASRNADGVTVAASAARRQRAWDAVQAWHQALQQRRADSASTKTEEILAALQHLWTVMASTSSSSSTLSMQRAALYMSTVVVRASEEGRHWWLFHPNLVELMDRLSDPVWQREAYRMLQILYEHSSDDDRNRATVSLQRFQQLYPSILVSENHDNNNDNIAKRANMVEWRRFRDLALEHAEREEQRVRKLVRRADTCIDILVPRMANAVIAAGTEPTSTSVQNQPQDSDEEGVDWEDGSDDHDKALNDHEDAVNRTMNVIQATVGVHNGGIEINFASSSTDVETHGQLSIERLQARQRFDKAVHELASIHMPRLTQWVEGLTQADGLLHDKTGDSVALVSMPLDQSRRRKAVLDTLLELKSTMARVFQSAKRLGLKTERQDDTTAGPTGAERPQPRINLGASHARLPGLSASLGRRRQSVVTSGGRNIAHSRSNRIQVKLRK